VISALNISRDYRYAEITEIRRDRREDFKSRQGLLFVQSQKRTSNHIPGGEPILFFEVTPGCV
jgi:hypothetical protein